MRGPSPKHMKHCSHCRLPIRAPGAAYPAIEDGQPFVFLICAGCHSRLTKLPYSTRCKALNRAADNVVSDPGRYAHKAFENEIDARLFAGLAGDLVTSADVVRDLLQGDSPSMAE